jgi:multiple sugar transport system substrate-binding protein
MARWPIGRSWARERPIERKRGQAKKEGTVSQQVVSRRRLIAGGVLALSGFTAAQAACAPTPAPTATAAPAKPSDTSAPKPTEAPKPAAAATTAPAATKPAAAAATAPAAAPAAAGKEVTLKVSHVTTAQKVWDDTFAAFWKSFTDKNPGIKLDIENNPFNGFDEKMLTSLAGGADYDIMYGYFQWIPTFAEKGVIRPLEDYLGSDKEVKLADFFPSALERWKGKIYGIAWFHQGWQMWFNDDLVKPSGVDPRALEKEGKWTWDALQDLARKLTKGDGGAKLYGYQHNVNYSVLIIPVWAAGADFWDADVKTSQVNKPEFIDAMQQQVDMTLKDKVTPLPAEQAAQGGPGFLNKRVAMTMWGPHAIRSIEEQTDKLKLFQAVLPKGKGPKREAPVATNAYYITTKGKNPDQAWTLYKHFLSAEGQKLIVPLGGGRMPANKNVAPQVAMPYEDPEVYKFTAGILRELPRIGKQAEFEKAFNTAMEEIFTQKKTTKQAMDDLAKSANDLAK